MAIADIANTQAETERHGPPCSVCQQLDELSDTEAAALRSLLANRAWRYQQLSDRLATEGVHLTAGQLSWHARGRCWAREKLRGA